jgi:hypothetical protein
MRGRGRTGKQEATEDTADPNEPVRLGGGGEMDGLAEDTDVKPLGGEVAVDDGGGEL